MSEETDNLNDLVRDDETMARLVRLSGGRSPIPSDIESRVYEQVESEWTASTTLPESTRVYDEVHRSWKKRDRLNGLVRWAFPLAIAASALLAIAVFIQPAPEPPTLVPVGTVSKVSGGDRDTGLPSIGRSVYPGDKLSTGPGEGISVALTHSESLRIDENSALLVEAADRFELLAGRVYADSGDIMYRNRHLKIETPLGEVTDIGTQFSVTIGDESLEVAVREGRVDVTRGTDAVTAVAGERLRIHRNDGATVDSLAAHSPYWNWATSLAPAFDIENKSLLDFLRWVARETGLELVFESNEVRISAMRTDLHGSISDFDPLVAVETVLTTTKFKYRLEDNKIIIGQ